MDWTIGPRQSRSLHNVKDKRKLRASKKENSVKPMRHIHIPRTNSSRRQHTNTFNAFKESFSSKFNTLKLEKEAMQIKYNAVHDKLSELIKEKKDAMNANEASKKECEQLRRESIEMLKMLKVSGNNEEISEKHNRLQIKYGEKVRKNNELRMECEQLRKQMYAQRLHANDHQIFDTNDNQTQLQQLLKENNEIRAMHEYVSLKLNAANQKYHLLKRSMSESLSVESDHEETESKQSSETISSVDDAKDAKIRELIQRMQQQQREIESLKERNAEHIEPWTMERKNEINAEKKKVERMQKKLEAKKEEMIKEQNNLQQTSETNKNVKSQNDEKSALQKEENEVNALRKKLEFVETEIENEKRKSFKKAVSFDIPMQTQSGKVSDIVTVFGADKIFHDQSLSITKELVKIGVEQFEYENIFKVDSSEYHLSIYTNEGVVCLQPSTQKSKTEIISLIQQNQRFESVSIERIMEMYNTTTAQNGSFMKEIECNGKRRVTLNEAGFRKFNLF